jgi:CRISPR/Cas system-associated exonuclease Cas4 (RecB family)
MRIQWSFSSLKDFVNCPKQYYEVKVAQNFVKKETEQMLYGKEVHKALEDYVKDGKPLAKNYERFRPVLDALVEIPGKKYPELEMALTKDKQPCDFKDDNRWVRGIADLVIVDNDLAYVVDYKTGSNKYPDPKQLKLMALMIFAHFPEVNHVKGGLLFVMHNSFMPEEYNRDEMDSMWGSFARDLARLELSYESNNWPAKPTGLCGWCPVASCTFHKVR